MQRFIRAVRSAFSRRSFYALAGPVALGMSLHQWHVLHVLHMARVAAESSYTVVQHSGGTGTYGHPYYCGDGDGDGWDVPCQHAGSPAALPVQHSGAQTVSYSYSGGVLSAGQVGQLWVDAGGPGWAEGKAVEIAYCESGYNPRALNPSGATGVWQILGQVTDFGRPLTDPAVNAANAVAKFRAAGDTFAAWVCQ